MSERTPTPWEAQPFDDAEFGIGIIGLRTNDGVPYSNPTNGLVGWATMLPTDIAAHDTSRAEANAAFIVKACNAHDILVKALEEEREYWAGEIACAMLRGDPSDDAQDRVDRISRVLDAPRHT